MMQRQQLLNVKICWLFFRLLMLLKDTSLHRSFERSNKCLWICSSRRSMRCFCRLTMGSKVLLDVLEKDGCPSKLVICLLQTGRTSNNNMSVWWGQTVFMLHVHFRKLREVWTICSGLRDLCSCHLFRGLNSGVKLSVSIFYDFEEQRHWQHNKHHSSFSIC